MIVTRLQFVFEIICLEVLRCAESARSFCAFLYTPEQVPK